MTLNSGRGRIDFLLQLLLHASLGQLRVPFGREDLVDALVVSAPDFADQIAQSHRVIDGPSGELAHPGGFSRHHQPCNRFRIVAVDGGLKRGLFLDSLQGTVGRGRLGSGFWGRRAGGGYGNCGGRGRLTKEAREQ
jgi:hypothetical protein